MFHYTYLLLHKTNGMRYIGVRSSKVSPLEDFLYWGSSRHIPSDVKKTHIKIILKEFSTRQEAVEHEILLHNLKGRKIMLSFDEFLDQQEEEPNYLLLEVPTIYAYCQAK